MENIDYQENLVVEHLVTFITVSSISLLNEQKGIQAQFSLSFCLCQVDFNADENCKKRKMTLFIFLGTNIRTNEEVAIKLVSTYFGFNLLNFDNYVSGYFLLIC